MAGYVREIGDERTQQDYNFIGICKRVPLLKASPDQGDIIPPFANQEVWFRQIT